MILDFIRLKLALHECHEQIQRGRVLRKNSARLRAESLAIRRGLETIWTLSAVDLPEMSGPDLGQLLKTDRPGMRVMQMSPLRNGNLLVLNYGWAYIQKQAIGPKLKTMIVDVLRTPDHSQADGQEFESSNDSPNR